MDPIERAAKARQQERNELANERDAVFNSLNEQLKKSDTLQSNGIQVRVEKARDCKWLVVARVLEGDRDFLSFEVGINNDGFLVGRWDGKTSVDQQKLRVDSPQAQQLFDAFDAAVVHVFDIRVKGS